MSALFNMTNKSVLSNLIEKAVDTDEDWSTILEICDLIIENKSRSKKFLQLIRTHIKSQNQKRALNAIKILDSASKNCGWPLHKEILSEDFMKFIIELIEQNNQPQVTEEIVKLLNFWRDHFKDVEDRQFLEKAVKMATDLGHQMTDLVASQAMVKADVLPPWKEGNSCSICEAPFSFINRKHHCRSCGAIVCAKCSTNSLPLPKFNITTPVRLCDSCFESAGGIPRHDKKAGNSEALDAEFEDQLKLALAESVEMENNRLKQSQVLELYKNFGSNQNSQEPQNIPATNQETQNISATNQETQHFPAENYLHQNFSAIDQKSQYFPATNQEQQNFSATEKEVSSTNNNYVPGPLTTAKFASTSFIHTFKSELKAFNLRLETCIQRRRPIHTDTGLHKSFTTLCSLYNQLRDIINHIYTRREYFEGLQDSVTMVNEEMEALTVLREEFVEKMRAQREEEERQKQAAINMKVDWLRKCKNEYYDYQRYMQMQKIQQDTFPPMASNPHGSMKPIYPPYNPLSNHPMMDYNKIPPMNTNTLDPTNRNIPPMNPNNLGMPVMNPNYPEVRSMNPSSRVISPMNSNDGGMPVMNPHYPEVPSVNPINRNMPPMHPNYPEVSPINPNIHGMPPMNPGIRRVPPMNPNNQSALSMNPNIHGMPPMNSNYQGTPSMNPNIHGMPPMNPNNREMPYMNPTNPPYSSMPPKEASTMNPGNREIPMGPNIHGGMPPMNPNYQGTPSMNPNNREMPPMGPNNRNPPSMNPINLPYSSIPINEISTMNPTNRGIPMGPNIYGGMFPMNPNNLDMASLRTMNGYDFVQFINPKQAGINPNMNYPYPYSHLTNYNVNPVGPPPITPQQMSSHPMYYPADHFTGDVQNVSAPPEEPKDENVKPTTTEPDLKEAEEVDRLLITFD